MLALTDTSDGLEGDCGDMTYSSKVQAAISIRGFTDFSTAYPQAPGLTSAFLGGPPEKFPDVYTKASPLAYVTKDAPPILLLTGDMDALSLQQAKILDAKLTAVGSPHTLVLEKGYTPYQIIWDEKEIWKFLKDNLRP